MVIKAETLLKPVYIYALVDPLDDEVFYVGQTTMPKTRLTGHIINSRNLSGNIERSNRINAIVGRGQIPSMNIIEETTREFAEIREQHWITHYLRVAPGLTNKILDKLPPLADRHK